MSRSAKSTTVKRGPVEAVLDGAEIERPEPLTIDPSPEAEVIEQPKTSLEDPAGHLVEIVYRGRADLVRHGEYRFRPDQPVEVPSDVAEELLTMPFERFERR